jgi:hypothetical protein
VQKFFYIQANLRQLKPMSRLARLDAPCICIMSSAGVLNEKRYFFGVTNSCVTRIVSSGEKPDVDDLIRKL